MTFIKILSLQILFFNSAVASAIFDFYQSKSKTNLSAPTFIFVHGGAWISGSKEQYRFVGELLAETGVCAVIASYSLAPKVKHPVPVDELNQTINAVTKKNSKGCSNKHIYLVGHSAGAHMIAYWNTKFSSSAVKGFVGIEGIYDLVKLSKVWPSYKDWFLTSAFGNEKYWADASPAQKEVKSKTNWLLVHSKADELVDLAQTVNFKKVLEKQKVPVEFLTLQKEIHFGSIEAALRSAEFKKFVTDTSK